MLLRHAELLLLDSSKKVCFVLIIFHPAQAAVVQFESDPEVDGSACRRPSHPPTPAGGASCHPSSRD